jgi:hypothetical protein
LKEKFSIYGVVIEQVNVMNVILPRDLRVCLMETTNYDVYLQKQVKWQENKLLIVCNNENKSILKLKRDNMQILFKLQHDFDVEEINALETQIRMETDQQIKKIDAMKTQSTKLIEAENQKHLAEIRSKKKATTLLKEAEAYDAQQRTLADAEVQIIKANAAARLEIASNKSQALEREAEAELNQSGNMEPMRRHTEKMELNHALQRLAENGNMIVSGKNGQNVLDFYNGAIDQISSRQ